MQEEFLSLVAEERRRGCTVFISSHELDEVQRVCDRVGIVRDGRLVAVERIADLLGRTRHRVEVELAAPDGFAELRALPGVSDLELDGARASFRFAGDPDPVVKALSHHTVLDLEVAHPTLEEVFLTYYHEGEEPVGGEEAGER
jgi:ABC-2 type transport system ATP-binding protein